MALNRRIQKGRRQKQRRGEQNIATRFNPFQMATVKGPKFPQEEHFVAELGIGRRVWSRQQKWPKELERRTFDPKEVYVISGKKGRITTTRRKPALVEAHLEENERRTGRRRTNKKLARQIAKASKSQAKADKRPK